MRKLGVCRITVFKSLLRMKILGTKGLSNLMGRRKMETSGWNTEADEFKSEVKILNTECG